MTQSNWPLNPAAIALSVLLTVLTAHAANLPIAGANAEQTLVVGGFPVSITPAQPVSLEGQDWILTRWEENNQTVAMVGASPTIQFSGQEVSGLGGCNRYRANYVRSDNEDFQIGDIVATRMACVDMTLMEQERRYLSALRAAQSLQWSTTQLTVAYRSPSGQPGQLFFSPPSAPSMHSVSQALKDSAWTLDRWEIETANQPLVPNTPVTLTFSADRVSGSGGCNRFGGTYQQQGEQLTLSTLIMTEMACASAATMQQESALLTAMALVYSAQVNPAGQLQLQFGLENGKTGLLIFRRVATGAAS